MSDEWEDTTLGTCFDLVRTRLQPGNLNSSAAYVGMENLATGRPHIVSHGRVGDVTSAVTPFLPGDTLFGRLRPYLRKVAHSDSDGFCSPEVLVLRPRLDRVSARFLHLLASSESLIQLAIDRSAGSRMPRVSAKDLASADITLPPHPIQERIISVIGSLDAQILALEAEEQAGRKVLAGLLAHGFSGSDASEQAIVSLCSHVVGGVWGVPEGEGEVDALALGPRIYTPKTSDFVTDGSPVRSFTAKQFESRCIRENDLILERSGGSPDQPVGRVAIAGAGLAPCLPTDFQRLLRPDPAKIEPRYLYWRLQHDWNDGLTRAYSRRTTGITNLSVKDYIGREIPVPEREDQIELVNQADAIELAVRALDAEILVLRAFRSATLSALLNRDLEIPASFDELLAEEAMV